MSQMANPYKPGGRNKIIWGDAVAPGSSGPGGVSYNAEAGGLYHILGYENDPVAPAPAAPTAAPNAAPKKASAAKPAAKKPAAPKSSPRPTAPVAASAPVSAGGGGTGGGGGSVATAPSMQALQDPAGGMMGGGDGGDGSMNVLTAPSQFRQGIGTRMLPNESASLAMLRKLY